MQLVLSLLQQMSVSLVIAYLFSKSPLLRPLANYSVRLPHKVLIYVIFSCFCILGTYVGLDIDDAIANTRAVGAVLGGLLGGPLVIIPILAFPITAVFAFIIQSRLRDTVQRSLALGAARQALLIETLGGLETLKACSAESERQHKWESTHGALTRLDSHARNLSALATNGTLFIQQFSGMATIVAGVYSIIAGNLSVGALVASVENGSPAEKAGLAPGDVVLGVNGQKVDNSDRKSVV